MIYLDCWEDFVSYRQSNPGTTSRAACKVWVKNGRKDKPGFGKYWRQRQKKINDTQKKLKEQKRNETLNMKNSKLVMTFDGNVATIHLR